MSLVEEEYIFVVQLVLVFVLTPCEEGCVIAEVVEQLFTIVQHSIRIS